MAKHKLKLSKLTFISPVDFPAQETATVRLIKRAGGDARVEGKARVVKLSDELGLVFLWAFTCEQDGQPYHDLQGDAIDHEFIKAAADYMLDGGGLTDEMHDRDPDGRVAFLMPMTPEIAAAYGVTTKTTGLMCALKPSPEVFAKFKSGEYTAVSIDGEGFRTAVKSGVALNKSILFGSLAARVVKLGVLTSETDGHQHTVALEDPGCEWMDSLSTSYQNVADAPTGHSHAWTFDAETGAITIGEDSGHTHTIDAVVPPAILAVVAARASLATLRAATDAGMAASAVLDAASDAAAAGAVVSVSIAARAPAGDSTPSAAGAKVASHQEIKPMPLLMKHLAILAAASAPQQAYAASLDESGAITFLEKSLTDRESIVKSAIESDPVVYKTAAGDEIRKSAGDYAVKLAKQVDAQAEMLATATSSIEKANAETARVQLEKRAIDPKEGIPFFKGEIAVKAAILGAVEGIKDETLRKSALESLRGANAISASITKSIGTSHTTEPGDETPVAKFEQGRIAFAKSKHGDKVTEAQIKGATGAFISTTEGSALYRDAYPSA